MPTRPSLALLTLLTLAGAAAADEVADARQALARFGGVVLARGEVHLEVTMGDDGVRIYPMDRQGAPAALYTMGGEVVIRAGERISAPGAPELRAAVDGKLLFPKRPARDAQGRALGTLPTDICHIVQPLAQDPAALWG